MQTCWRAGTVALALLGMTSACGDDGAIAQPGSSGITGSGATTGNASTTRGEPAGSTDSTGREPDSSTGFEPPATSTGTETGASSTGPGDALPEPDVFRTPDRADVCGPTPQQPCTPADMAWVAAEYGAEVGRADPQWVDVHGAVYRLIALVERVGPSNIDVFVVDESGSPLAGTAVAFYYDSLRTPSRPDEWYPVKVEATTDGQGRAGFALGPGAYLDACGGGGPHAVWVSEPGTMPDTTVASDLADHLGM
ncbi:MAG: hypothetical protein K0V04_42995, partial [Deltaproteobacteria bacterium]|nr:hypothetical protein [Deltaproteobacteria bacterium]